MSDIPNIDIRPDHWEIVRDILCKFVPEYEVWAFGSRAKWTAKAYSDLDLAVISDKPLPIQISANLADAFSDSDLPWKVDVVDWATTNELFRRVIEKEKVTIQKHQSKASGWLETTLAAVSIDVSYGYTESASRSPVGPKFLRITDIQNGVVDWATVPFCPISQSDHQKYRLVAGDIVVARTGNSTGENYLFSDDVDAVFASYLIRFRIDKNTADPGYIWYNLRSQEWRAFIDGSKTGSAQAGANAQVMGRFPIRLPSLAEQRRISKVLGSLDKKIELNRRANGTLEEMAHSLFKAWFVSFDGVPSEDMQESELGLIPRGWVSKPLDSIANYINGLALQKFPPESETEYLPVVKIAQLRAGNTVGADKASARIKSEYIVEDGDVLFSWSGSLEVKVWTGGRGALNQHLFKITSREVPKWFYYFATLQHLSDFRAIAAGKATTMGHIQRGHLSAARIAVPPPYLMRKFDAIIAPLFEQKIKNAIQTRSLASMRDALLPSLLSGRLRVDGDEITLGERA